MSKHDFNTGIWIVRYVHSLIGLAGNTITKKDVDTQCEGIFSSNEKLTTDKPIGPAALRHMDRQTVVHM